MNRLIGLALLASALVLGFSPAVEARGNAIAKSMGDLRWGMSDLDVVRFLKRKAKRDYAARIKKAKGSSASALKKELAGKLKALDKGYVEFDGRSRWDRSPISNEYTHGNGEGMIAYDDGKSKNYYFFINGELWKWYKSFDASAFGGKNFDRFRKTIGKHYGKGFVKTQERTAGEGVQQFVEYLDRRTRLRAVDYTADSGEFALVFEQMSTVRSLSGLRSNGSGRVKKRQSAVARKSESDDKDYRAGRSPASGFKKSNKKSIFGDNAKSETETEYRNRVKRERAAAERKQRSMHKRRKDREKGKALDGLGDLEDDDPLAGF